MNLLSYAKSETEIPRRAATSSARFNCFKPSTVARTMLIGVLEPSDLDAVSYTHLDVYKRQEVYLSVASS